MYLRKLKRINTRLFFYLIVHAKCNSVKTKGHQFREMQNVFCLTIKNEGNINGDWKVGHLCRYQKYKWKYFKLVFSSDTTLQTC